MSLLSPPRLRVACKPFPVWDVTTRSETEVNPAQVGLTAEAVAAIWRAVERYYETGLSPAIALCLRREGEVVIDRAIGHAHGNGPSDDAATPKVLATPKTPFVVFSTSKAITATLIHLLDERGQLRLDDRVCEFIPEFGLHQKEWITIRHLLTHRAGIPMIAGVEVDLDLLSHHERVLEILCAAKPVWRPGQRLAYHALSGGFVLGEVIRRITSAPLNDLITEAIRKPLGLETLTYGIPIERAGEVASSYFTGLKLLPPLRRMAKRALGVDFYDACELANDPRFLAAVVPAGNVVSTANDLSAFFQLLLNGGSAPDGQTLLEPRTVRRALTEHAHMEVDMTLGIPLRYGLGFMLGRRRFSLYGPDTRRAFGHLGFTNVFGYADPERKLSVGLLTSGKPLITPGLIKVFDIVRKIALNCPKVA